MQTRLTLLIQNFSFNSHTEYSIMGTNLFQPLVAAVISAAIAIRSYRRKSLDLSGAIAGFVVMTIHIAVNYRFGAALLVFFFTSSMFTKFGEEKKRQVDADYKEGGQRNWIQVLFNSGIATILVLIAWKLMGSKDYCLDSKESGPVTALIGGILGHYCCCNGDTWSSELGVLSQDQPRLITTLKPVRKGTNGGVTKAGLLAAAAGGSVIVSAIAGLCGSLVDSVLGATLQYSGFCTVRNKVVGKPGPTVKKISGLRILDNNAVNLVSISLTTALTAFACLFIF
ncbi:protein PGR isoform X2 [Andrographis paniculata]|uniref:protein PGR isoform X2 n=1 Tax=Andrographis paniculata TaxID=175694 RepID=UPI0021E7308A|nr:protein PGR isoform X2 [Andrographis paniculata]